MPGWPAGLVESVEEDRGYHIASVPAKPNALWKDRTADAYRRDNLESFSEAPGTESYDDVTDNPFAKVTDAPLSTFSIDVDTASYANVRRFLNSNTRPPKAAVRIEELRQLFPYDYPQPEGDTPFSAAMEVAGLPVDARSPARPRRPARAATSPGLTGPASNLVFLIDVSGSMAAQNKLPLVKQKPRSCSSISSATTIAWPSSSMPAAAAASWSRPRHAQGCHPQGAQRSGKRRLHQRQRAASSSPTSSPRRHFIKGGTNRVILATDGDLNVGITDQGELSTADREEGERRRLPHRPRLRHGQPQGRHARKTRRQGERQLRLHRHAARGQQSPRRCNSAARSSPSPRT